MNRDRNDKSESKKKKTPIGQELKMTEKILFHMKLVMKTMN